MIRPPTRLHLVNGVFTGGIALGALLVEGARVMQGLRPFPEPMYTTCWVVCVCAILWGAYAKRSVAKAMDKEDRDSE